MIASMIRRGFTVFVASVLAVTLVVTTEASAMSIDCSKEAAVEAFREFASQNNIAFFDPCEVGACSNVAGGSLTAPAPSSLEGNSNAQKVWNYLLTRGLTPVAAAGALGNIEQESGFNPWIGEQGSTSINKEELLVGFGLIQWTNTEGNTQGRRYGIMKYMEDNGINLGAVNTSDPELTDKALLLQLNYLWDQEYGSATWQDPVNRELTVEGDPTIETSADNTGNGSTLLFHSLVERSNDGAEGRQERITSAQAYLLEYGKDGDTGGDCRISDGGLTMEQAQKVMNYYRDVETRETISALFNKPGSSADFFLTSSEALCGAGDTPAGRDVDLMSRLANCTAFSTYFVAKYTSMNVDGWGDGRDKASKLALINPGAQEGDTPKVFAVFSRDSGTYGHTGIILGIDGENVIIGEAACGGGYAGIAVRQATIAEMSGAEYHYMYTTGINQEALATVANG